MKHNLKIGQRIFLDPFRTKTYTSKNPIEVEIISIGTVFFRVKSLVVNFNFNLYKFHIHTMVNEGRASSPSYRCYTSMRELKEHRERQYLCGNIFNRRSLGLSTKKFTLDQLRKVAEILEIEEES